MIGGNGLAVVHLSCNDGHWLAIQHFAENERNFYSADFRWLKIYLYLDLPPYMGYRWTCNREGSPKINIRIDQ